ncbi:MAG: hypothetical protein GF320_11635 [Armatimonadia bacterium]|nr:hypothetical protein [Armatimonadia bacterium]
MISDGREIHKAGVLFGLANPNTASDIATLAASLARFHSTPAVALSVLHSSGMDPLTALRVSDLMEQGEELFEAARECLEGNGVELLTEMRLARSASDGIVATVRDLDVDWVVLGHPRQDDAAAFDKIVEAVAHADVANIIVASLLEPVPACGRILVPVTHPSHVAACAPVANALTDDCGDILVLDIVSSEASERDVEQAEAELEEIAEELMPHCGHEVRRADSKVHAILEASKEAHMVLLRADHRKGLSRLFFGSLANEIADSAECTVLMLHPRDNSAGDGD